MCEKSVMCVYSSVCRGIAETHSGMTQDKHLVIIPAAQIKYMSENIP